MITPVNETLTAYRWQPYVEQLIIEGVDMASASISIQVRLYPDQPGDPYLFITRNDNPNAQGIAVLDTKVVAGLPVATLQIRINETTLEQLLPGFTSGLEIGSTINLAYDLVIDAPGIPKARWLTGAFLLVPGANQA